MFTAPPTPVPTTQPPTLSHSPTDRLIEDPVVRIQGELMGHYLWARSDGGFKANQDNLPLANTAIKMIRSTCPQTGHYVNDGLSKPCFILKFELGRKIFAKTGQSWANGVGATTAEIDDDQIWYLQATECNNGGASGTCVIIRNARNGRFFYHNDELKLGCSPGSTTDYSWASAKFHLIDAQTDVAIDTIAAGLQ